tara:strand:+ start:57 stop:425 length:369 start_codon:yes stop_codon:yes gene_type:complete
MLTKKDQALAILEARRVLKKLDSGHVEYYGKNPCFKPETHNSAVNLAKAVTKAGIKCEAPTLEEWELMVAEDELGRKIKPVVAIYKATFDCRKTDAIFGPKSFDDVIVSKTALLAYVERVKL